MWTSLTTPPPPRPRGPQHPLFTRDFFSTKSFGPGHVVGAGILALGLVGITRLFVKRGQEEAGRSLASALPPADAAKIARIDRGRGEYGR